MPNVTDFEVIDHGTDGEQYFLGYCTLCGAKITKYKQIYTRPHDRRDYPVCSQACASAPWIHRDGGYAFKQEWL